MDVTHEGLAKRCLAVLMSSISEETMCSGWIVDNEHLIWRAVQTGNGVGDGPHDYSQESIDECKALSEICGGWIVWYDSYDRSMRFVPLGVWRYMHLAWEMECGNGAA